MKKHILLIDHDKNELTAFMAALKEIQGDFKCTYAESSAQALEMLKYLQPDFIFIDYDLPEVNGLRLLSVIRNEPALKQAKIFIYTEMVKNTGSFRLYRKTCNCFLADPPVPGDLRWSADA
ncbi:MAG: response regulator [Bacteroidetes bacterium]|nr:MAG: response regulator [Bacteroidota bacterium]